MLEDTLTLEVLEQSLERERMEVMERQLATADDALASREVMIREEANERVAGVRRALPTNIAGNWSFRRPSLGAGQPSSGQS